MFLKVKTFLENNSISPVEFLSLAIMLIKFPYHEKEIINSLLYSLSISDTIYY